MPKGIFQRKTLSERLEELTERDERTGCLYFKGHLDKDGYGTMSITEDKKRMTKQVHRVVWEQANGKIEKGKVIIHLCDDKYPVDCKEYRKCCELSHLKIGTNQENMDRMKQLGRSVVTSGAFKKGDMTGAKNTRAILNEEDVKSIRQQRSQHNKNDCSLASLYKQLSDEYDVAVITIQKIVGNKIWIDPSYTPP